MTDRPIIFSAPMVRALRAGRKTQTRRVLKIPRWAGCASGADVEHDSGGALAVNCDETGCLARLPVAAPGDRLWVRETWRTFVSLDKVTPRDLLNGGRGAGILYEADGASLSIGRGADRERRYQPEREDRAPFGVRRPAIYLPRWASRLTLIVTDVRIERLQEITDRDCIAEGADQFRAVPGDARLGTQLRWAFGVTNDGRHFCEAGSPTGAYELLWDSINGAGSWDKNPWVAAITFTPLFCNIDQVKP